MESHKLEELFFLNLFNWGPASHFIFNPRALRTVVLLPIYKNRLQWLRMRAEKSDFSLSKCQGFD